MVEEERIEKVALALQNRHEDWSWELCVDMAKAAVNAYARAFLDDGK